MKYITVIFSFISYFSFCQTNTTTQWDGFYQSFDISDYRGGEFILTGFVKVADQNESSSAHLFARVDKKKGHSFFDNMSDRPIKESKWKEYVIRGSISKKGERLFIGGMYVGSGKFYFDQFSLKIRSKNADWKLLHIPSSDFEKKNMKENWKSFFDRYDLKTSTENAYNGERSLMINTYNSFFEVEGNFVKANGIDIHYKKFGQGDTVLFLHGNSQSLNSFEKQIPEISKNYFVIAMDSRGQGKSSKDERKISYKLMSQDVIAFLDKTGIKRAHIIGWSDGGIIGLQVAMNQPERVKTLSIMGANLWNDNTSLKNWVNQALNEELKTLSMTNSKNDQFRIEMIELMLNEPNIEPENLKQITCPVLVISGTDDAIKIKHTELIASKIINSELVIFDGGTHNEPIKNPKRFNDTVLTFLGKYNK
ncbi:MAG: alpha/beta hydrolase [Fulvivirga sp.]